MIKWSHNMFLALFVASLCVDREVITDALIYCWKDATTTEKPAECPTEAELLFNVAEIKKVHGNAEKEEISIYFYDDSNTAIDDMKAKSITLSDKSNNKFPIRFVINNDGKATFTSKVVFEYNSWRWKILKKLLLRKLHLASWWILWN